jgi:hypothetical protein
MMEPLTNILYRALDCSALGEAWSMSKEPQAEWVVPNPQIPRTFGILHIIFGGLMLLVGAAYGVFYFVMPAFTRQMQATMQQAQATAKAARETTIAELKKKEAAAKTEQEKEDLRDERQTLELRVEPDMTAFNDLTGMGVMADKRVAVFYWSEIVTGILLNIAMIVAGAGLLALAEWGRRLSLAIAWLKIARWVAIPIVTLVLILPITTRDMQKAFGAMNAQMKVGGAAPRPVFGTDFARVMAAVSAAGAVFNAVVASIYPGLSIWFLTRPRARAACIARPQPKPTEPIEELEGSW